MRCVVSIPLKNIQYSWYKDDKFLAKGINISFENLRKDNLGSYKCIASGQEESGKQKQVQESIDLM